MARGRASGTAYAKIYADNLGLRDANPEPNIFIWEKREEGERLLQVSDETCYAHSKDAALQGDARL